MTTKQYLKDKFFIECPTCEFYYKEEFIDFVNEYTIRNIQLAVKNGELNHEDIFFIDKNVKYFIDKNGNLSDIIPLMSTSYELMKKLLFGEK
ncbi:MAG TPA: hypothetical protein VFF27_07130 [Bacteroidia bacterium]|jgi:hypothetical protein|nr:hypothetical protein [Bacteroidia bacterium]